MTTVDSLEFELRGRFDAVSDFPFKSHVSVRWEPLPAVVRVGACIDPYNWDTRMAAISALVAFEVDHADRFSVEFDVVPLTSVNDEAFASA